MKPSLKNFFLKRLKGLSALVVLLSFAGYLDTIHWTFELTAHFKVPYFVLSWCCTLVFLWVRLWKWAILGLLGIVMNSIVVFAWYLPPTDIAIQNPHLKLLLSNVNIRNHHYSTLLTLINTEAPDIVIVQEGNAGWIDSLKVLTQFPNRLIPQDSYGFGTVIFSRIPFEHTQIMPLGSSKRETLLIQFQMNGKLVSLVTTHPLPPLPKHFFEHRNSQLFAAASVVKQLPAPKILVGDLNISMWAPIYSKLQADMGLINARQGFGILPTWPTTLPFLMIPIDHYLISPDIHVVNLKTAQRIGSDHLPLIVELTF